MYETQNASERETEFEYARGDRGRRMGTEGASDYYDIVKGLVVFHGAPYHMFRKRYWMEEWLAHDPRYGALN